jgi:hypothetical protein
MASSPPSTLDLDKLVQVRPRGQETAPSCSRNLTVTSLYLHASAVGTADADAILCCPNAGKYACYYLDSAPHDWHAGNARKLG